jgi:predicted DsbA family dithiol-disulfide isomerase
LWHHAGIGADGAAPERVYVSAPLTIQLWSDLICPFCWIGERRLEQALESFAGRDQVHIVYRSFRLMPGVKPHPVETMLAQRYGTGPEQVAQMHAQVTNMAAEMGLTYKLAGTLTGDTLDGHRLAQFARTQDMQREVVHRLYRAYFSEHQSLFDRDTLLRLAVEAGLERNAAADVLAGDSYSANVEADERAARSLQANGVPFFVIGDRVRVSGAQPTGQFLAALNSANA